MYYIPVKCLHVCMYLFMYFFVHLRVFVCSDLSRSPSCYHGALHLLDLRVWNIKPETLQIGFRVLWGVVFDPKAQRDDFEYISMQCINKSISENWQASCFRNYALSAKKKRKAYQMIAWGKLSFYRFFFSFLFIFFFLSTIQHSFQSTVSPDMHRCYYTASCFSL